MTSPASLALVLAAAVAVGSPAAAQSPGPADRAADGTPPAVTGTLPDGSLPAERSGAVGHPVIQGTEGRTDATGAWRAPTGGLSEGSLAEERQGAIGGAVTQGGGSGERNQPAEPSDGSAR